jgi:hypothetical protein
MSGCGTRIVLRGQKPLVLCDRCPCFGSLFPPLAALTFAASSIICAFGLAAAAPRSPYRHLELCGIALAIGCNELSERSRPFPILPTIIGQYKSGVSRAAGFPVWQKSYHDHIIRNHFDYEEIWLYIQQNPQKWLNDLFYTEF